MPSLEVYACGYISGKACVLATVESLSGPLGESWESCSSRCEGLGLLWPTNECHSPSWWNVPVGSSSWQYAPSPTHKADSMHQMFPYNWHLWLAKASAWGQDGHISPPPPVSSRAKTASLWLSSQPMPFPPAVETTGREVTVLRVEMLGRADSD